MTTDATFRPRSDARRGDVRRHVTVGAFALLAALVVVALLSDASSAALFVPTGQSAVPLPELGPGVVAPPALPALPAPDVPNEALIRLESAMTDITRELTAVADAMVSLATGSR